MKDIKLWEDDDGFLVAFNADGSSFKMFYKKADTVPDAAATGSSSRRYRTG